MVEEYRKKYNRRTLMSNIDEKYILVFHDSLGNIIENIILWLLLLLVFVVIGLNMTVFRDTEEIEIIVYERVNEPSNDWYFDESIV